MTEWYYSKMGLQQGPVPEDELLTKIRRGEIDGANLVWKEGMGEWKPLSQIPELTGSSTDEAPALNALPAVANSDTTRDQSSSAPGIPQAGGNIPLPQPHAYRGDYITQIIPNYMWQSVVATVVGIFFCCLLAMPFGIVAIVFASKVEGLRVSGDTHGATTASNTAKNWMIASFACSGLGLVLQIGRLASM